MPQTIATKFGCCPLKTECTSAIDAMHWYMSNILPTVYILLRHNWLYLFEYSSKQKIQHFVCNSPFIRREGVLVAVCMLWCLCSENWTELSSLFHHQMYPYVCSSLTPSYWHFFFIYETCSKCMLAHVPPIHRFASNLRTKQQICSELISSQIVPNSFLFVGENVKKNVIVLVIQNEF